MNASIHFETSDCRSRLLQAAAEVFIEEGYRASIERVAQRAGVARQTLYNHFPSKADLFSEVIRQATKDLLVSLGEDTQPLRERLQSFGLTLRRKALNAEGLGFYRALLAEASSQPEVAETFYRTGPCQTAEHLSQLLGKAMSQGQIREEDPKFATNILLSMLVEAERSQSLLTGKPPPDTTPAYVERIVDCFLRAFAP